MPCRSNTRTHPLHNTTALLRCALIAGILAAAACVSQALANTAADRDKPINISADTSEYDEKAGTQVLAGNVEITQGSMVIKAERIKVELKNNALFRITGSGAPIRFQQLTENNELLRGQSDQISYNTETSEITFKGNAALERPGQKFTGHSINYNMTELTFKAAGNEKGRVSIILQPGR